MVGSLFDVIGYDIPKQFRISRTQTHIQKEGEWRAGSSCNLNHYYQSVRHFIQSQTNTHTHLNDSITLNCDNVSQNVLYKLFFWSSSPKCAFDLRLCRWLFFMCLSHYFIRCFPTLLSSILMKCKNGLKVGIRFFCYSKYVNKILICLLLLLFIHKIHCRNDGWTISSEKMGFYYFNKLTMRAPKKSVCFFFSTRWTKLVIILESVWTRNGRSWPLF